MVDIIPIKAHSPMETIVGCLANNIAPITIINTRAEKKMATLWYSSNLLLSRVCFSINPFMTKIL